MWKWTQRTFAGGQQDLNLSGRQDLATYFNSARTLENFNVKRQGCISKRRGTELVANLNGLFGEGYTLTHARIIPFVYERDGGYMLLFAEGAKIDEDGSLISKIFVLSSRGVLLDDGKTYSRNIQDGDTPFSIDVAYRGAHFNEIGYEQCGDTLWVAHPQYRFAKIVRGKDALFSFSIVDFLALGGSSQVPVPIIASATTSGFDSSSTTKRSVEYVVTAVKDGVESHPSPAFKVTYPMPWGSKAVINITISKTPDFVADYYNVYKKNSGEFGFIGSTSHSTELVSITGAKADDPTRTIRTNKDLTVENTPLIMSGVAGRHGYGRIAYIYGTGTVVINFDVARYIDQINIAGGYAYATWQGANTAYPTAYAQLLPCMAKVFKVKVTFNDGTQSSIIQTQGFSQEYKNTAVPSNIYPNGAWDSRWASDISDAIDAFGATDYVSAVIYDETVADSTKKPVKKIEITGYADAAGTKVATGDVAPTGTSVKITGDPVVLSSVSFVTFGNTSRTFEDDYITPDVSLTPPIVEDHFNVGGDYPSCVAIQDQRLALAATDKQPFTMWMSTVGDLYNFNTHDSIREDDAIEATIPATEFPQINHIVASKNLIMLCDNGEWMVRPTSGNTISYKTIEIKQQSQIGCSKRLPPLPVVDELIFAESTSETLRSMKYDWTSDGYQTTDLSVLSQSLTRNNPIVDWAYKQHPDSTIVCVLQDGSLAVLTYMKEHEVCAWSTAKLGGGLKAVGVCTDKAIRSGTTDLYILATDANGIFSLLRVREDSPAATVEESLCLDAMQTIEVAQDATKLPTIPKGMVAYDLADGTKVDALSKGHAYAMGYPYDAIFRSITPEAQGEATIQFELKGAKSIELRLENASAFKVIPSVLEHESDGSNYWSTCGDDVEIIDGKVTYSRQDHIVDLAGDANTSGAITIKSDSPWPITVLSYSINFEFDPRLLGQRG